MKDRKQAAEGFPLPVRGIFDAWTADIEARRSRGGRTGDEESYEAYRKPRQVAHDPVVLHAEELIGREKDCEEMVERLLSGHRIPPSDGLLDLHFANPKGHGQD